MNKKLSIFLLCTTIALSAFGWGRDGHATVAQVAENHLTKKAKKAIENYLGGLPITTIASDGDYYLGVWTLDLGFHPTNPDFARGKGWVKNFDFSTPTNIARYPHCIAVDENFNPYHTDNFNGEFFENATIYIDRLIKKLKENAKGMDPQERHIAICEIVHLVGDMHCPMHIAYYGKDQKRGFFDVTIRGKKENLHHYWDGPLFTTALPWSYGDLAKMADNASKKEIKAICKGDIFDWAKASAMESWPAHNVKPGDDLGDFYPFEMRALCLKTLRNGGYRLAALLNDIFK